jgi:asparagine synthase (glutamine-hydrolysing)
VKVLLSGTGGDEVFAGYSRYVGNNVRRKLWYALPNGLRQALGRTIFYGTSLGARMRHVSLDMMMVTGGSLRLAGYVMKSERPFSEFLEHLATNIFPVPDYQCQPLYRHMQFDLQVYLPDLLLMLLDQLTMAHTVEGRVPLLDVPLVTASYGFVAKLHANPLCAERRRLMRHMGQGRLDPQTFAAPKQGFSGPVLSWILKNRSRFMDVVMAARNIPVLSHLPLEKMWNAGHEGRDPFWAPEVFSLYCFSAWYHARVSA